VWYHQTRLINLRVRNIALPLLQTDNDFIGENIQPGPDSTLQIKVRM